MVFILVSGPAILTACLKSFLRQGRIRVRYAMFVLLVPIHNLFNMGSTMHGCGHGGVKGEKEVSPLMARSGFVSFHEVFRAIITGRNNACLIDM